MMTLKEFITEVNTCEHYRVFQPNRDCLIFESYFKVHSPYYFDERYEDSGFLNHNYYDDNDFCNDVIKYDCYDKETLDFLNRFGNYIVFRMEIGSFKPIKMYKDKNNKLKIEYIQEDKSIKCYNLFIIPPMGRDN